MEKSIINLNCRIEVLSKDLNKEQIIESIQLVSNNPEVLITNRIKADISIESHKDNLSEIDPAYIGYFRFFKKN